MPRRRSFDGGPALKQALDLRAVVALVVLCGSWNALFGVGFRGGVLGGGCRRVFSPR